MQTSFSSTLERTVTGPSKGTKHLVTGRFDSRFELELVILQRYHNTGMNQSQIARLVDVSQGLVSTIVAGNGRYIYQRRKS